MTKKEVAKKLRSLLTRAIRTLPDDVEYKSASMHEDFTSERERNHEEQEAPGKLGSLHLMELTVEAMPYKEGGEE